MTRLSTVKIILDNQVLNIYIKGNTDSTPGGKSPPYRQAKGRPRETPLGAAFFQEPQILID